MGLFDFFRKKIKPVDNKYVFDKAKYHDGSIEQLGLDEEQSFVTQAFSLHGSSTPD